MDWVTCKQLEQNALKLLAGHDDEYAADEQPKVYEGSGTLSFRFEYEELLVQYNRRLAAARSDHSRLETVEEEAKAKYGQARERHDGILRDFGQQIVQYQKEIVALESKKHQSTMLYAVRRSAKEAMYENRRAQYDRMIDELKANSTFEEGKHKAAAEKERRKIVLMDKISSVSQYIDDLRKNLRENLFAVDQMFVCQNVRMNYEQESGLAKMFEVVLMNHKCDQTDFIQKINEYYDMVTKVEKIRNVNEEINNEIEKYITLRNNTKLIKHLPSNKNHFMNKKIRSLTKKNEMAKLEKERLIVEIENQKIKQEDSLNSIQKLNKLEHNVQENIEDSLNILKRLKEFIIIANELKERKCNYVQNITDKVLAIVKEIRQCTIGKKLLQSEILKNIYCVLGMINPLIAHLEKIKIGLCD